MWYPKKLSLFIKSLNFIVILSSVSVVNAADETKESIMQPKRLSIQVEHSDKFGFGQKDFLKKEEELIEGRKLNLWGVALFSANDPVGAGIRLLTASEWSHVGLILQDETDLSLYCFESTGSPTDILDAVLPQVQIHNWQDVVDGYNGKVAQRQFIFSQQAPKSVDVVNYVTANLGKSYEKDITSLIRAIRGENTKSDVSSVFCSEMTADCLITLGYLDGTFRLADNYVPGHFSSKQLLPWMNGASLGAQIMVKRKATSSCCTIM